VAGYELAKFAEMAREMISSVSTGTKTKNANLHRDEIKKRKHQILNFKNQTFHLLPVTGLCFFFLSNFPQSLITITTDIQYVTILNLT
jgi:hypothetical protein